jgi:hypothetical protein
VVCEDIDADIDAGKIAPDTRLPSEAELDRPVRRGPRHGEERLELQWVNRGRVIARLGDRTVTVGGEALLEHDPDYMIYARYITAWDDGALLGEDEKARLLEQVVEEAARRGWKFEIEW